MYVGFKNVTLNNFFIILQQIFLGLLAELNFTLVLNFLKDKQF